MTRKQRRQMRLDRERACDPEEKEIPIIAAHGGRVHTPAKTFNPVLKAGIASYLLTTIDTNATCAKR